MRYVRIENAADPSDFDLCKMREATFNEDVQALLNFAKDIDAEVKIVEITKEQYYFSLDKMAHA